MKVITTIAILLFTGVCLYGQNVVVTTEAPSVVTVGEQFRLTYTANTRGGTIHPPAFTDFYLLMGPQSSFSQNTSLSNGKVTQTIKNSFTYFLQATKEGKFTIEPATYTEKNKSYKSRSVSVEVISAEEKAKSGSTTVPDQANSDATDLYIRLLVNRSRVTMGEHIVATLKIYSKINLSGIQEVKFPDFNGFLKTDLETVPLRALERENVNGEIYNTGVLQRFLIYPQKTGTLSIDPSSLTVLLQQRTKSNDPFFGDFFSSFNNVPKEISTLPVDIEVSPLPGGAPDSFHGCVGSLSMSSEISADSISVNDAITLRLTIKGRGNLKLSGPPRFMLSSDIEIYDPKIESKLKSTANGDEGSKVFEYVLIPRHHGKFEIPPIKYSYYDPDLNRYKTLTTSLHTFFVNKDETVNEETQLFGAVNKESITYLGRDIRYIHSGKVKLKRKNQIIISRSSFIVSYLSALFLFVIIVIWRREHLKRNADIIKVKNRKAAKVATQRLKSAGKFLKEDRDEDFFSEVLRALWGYLSDKLSIPVSELNIKTASDALIAIGIKDETLKLLNEVIETCEFSRYSPSGNTSSNKEIFVKAGEVIKVIEYDI